MKRGALLAAALTVAVASAACETVFGTASPRRGTLPCCTQQADALELVYLGAGGWLLQYGGEALLTGPFFSNPDLVDLTVGAITPDTAAIARGLPDVAHASGVLVGHAHYDHLMDVPFVLERAAPNAPVFGSTTTANILAGTPGLDPSRIRDVEADAGTVDQVGVWSTVANGRIRFMPLISDHAPHFQGIELYEGEVTQPLDTLPKAADEWVGGTTLAFLVDFLNPDGSIAFRVHYQDAASSWPGGAPPTFSPPDDHPVDVAILCGPSYGEVEAYPEGILGAVAPRHAIVGHWEDFFSDWTRTPARSVAGSDINGFSARVERALAAGATWSLPNPGDTLRVAPR